MKQFDDIKQLADELKNIGICNKKFMVGIDGFLGAGKTFLANNLRDILGANYINVIDIDDKKRKYYPRNKGSIIKYTNFKKIKEDIINSKTSIFFTSACLLQIFEKIKITPNIYIYVKKMTKQIGRAPNIWLDKDDCMFADDINKWERSKILKTLRFDSQINTVDVKKSLMITKEVVQYHQKYKPYESAKYYYNRNENL